MITRIKYWNCSKLADFIRGTKKPYALELKEWEKWRKECQQKNPIRYWIAEVFLRKLQNFVYFPVDVYQNIKHYFINRFNTKTHYLKTGLKPGVFHELDERMLHGLFNELNEFVEVEIANMHSSWTRRPNGKKYKFKKGRCPEAGLDYLKWASKIKHNKKPTAQAISAKKIIKLYNWWKNRPNRPDPISASGWSEYCEQKHEIEDILELNPEKKGEEILNRMHRLESKYDKEDENMLIELIKIRHELWT